MSWYPSCSNSLWQVWSYGLVHCPGGNVTDPIWTVLASSWTPLKPQHSNPNPNPLTNQLWCIDYLTPPTPLIIPHGLPAFLESLMQLKMVEKQSEAFYTFLWHFVQVLNRILLHIVLLKCQIAFLKFTSSDDQALVGCIPIAAVAVHLNLKS